MARTSTTGPTEYLDDVDASSPSTSCKRYGIVYLLTNRVNGRKYVGQTRRNLRKRWKGHLWAAKDGDRAINRAIRKYGKRNFSKDVLCRCYSQEELNEKELYYTNLHRAWVHQHGYTCQAGNGKGTLSPISLKKISKKLKGRQFSESHKQAIAAALTGRKRPASFCKKLSLIKKGVPNLKARGRVVSAETRSKISAAKKGRFCGVDNPNYGNKWSDEAKRKMSEKLTGRILSHAELEAKRKQRFAFVLVNPAGKCVGGIGIRRFGKKHGLTRPHLSRLIRGVLKSYKGWRLPKEGE